ncbi:MAG: hypothetical protein GWN99_13540 [Gemmatimonadetes bacterium]|uniref:Regulator of chromosome condensation (RCC1) repeat-containing protein n=1 Tax=Candidatus Kutchimonas denitrificans TaxID=3056748 RepID=A0AAE4Z926_9BACT|nr:hypothetical protein [Gemmatimonadota bacterium]NIR75908.1 hypothetical protein [Candidatus Kutchimonas denitrificans]NIS02069.1 hypothetical protein [Gemmatimonadota bacterium]NIT67875.1 hypothetical protein [Gemmatimonadota bacterium]NIU53854.1 hypothetical protein [Gemmatimonadota bacterium]
MFSARLFRYARPTCPVRRRLALAGVVVALAVALSCDETSGPQELPGGSVSVSPDRWGMVTGGNVPLTGTVLGPDSRIPVPVATDARFESIGAFAHGYTCGVGTDGLAYCWGHNDFGMLGRGSINNDEYDVAPAEGSITFTMLDGMDFSTCGASTDGSAYCWGWGPDYLGNGMIDEPVPVPTRVNHDAGFATVDVGSHHKCGLGLDGVAYCWGEWAGDGTWETRLTPVRVAGQR